MLIRLDPSSGEPIYTQVARQVRALVAGQRLLPGQELPSIRALAERLLINPSTVARAYAELEVSGIVIKRTTAGTFISDQAPALARVACRDALAERLDELLAEAQNLGVDLDGLLSLIRERHTARVNHE